LTYISPPWPPELDRDAVLFGEALINLYRDVQGRDVDTLGWVRWGSEYRMHRANGLSHGEATERIRQEVLRIWGVSAPAPPPSPITPIGEPRLMQVTHDGQYHPRFYSYWSNAWINGDRARAFVFAGHTSGEVRFFEVDLRSGDAVGRDWPFPYRGTTEGWSWGPIGEIYMLDGPRLRMLNPFTGVDRVVMDISERFPGCRLWQSHSSLDGRTHCATVERITDHGPYQRTGTVVLRDGDLQFFEARGVLDESQISDNFLIIKENDDNRIVDLRTGRETVLRDADGAVGHSDCWQDFLIGEDNHQGACVRWDLNDMSRAHLFSTWNMGHVSARGGRLLVSDSSSIRLLTMDGAVLSTFAHGAEVTDYDSQVRANLDPSGRVACFMMRGEVYLLIL
jgi:hypothetical protein